MESLSNDQPFRADLVRNATLVRAPGAVPIPKSTIVIRDGLSAESPAPAHWSAGKVSSGWLA